MGVSSEVEEALLTAAVAMLQPLVRQMIEAGVVFGKLEERLRELFVAVAEAELSRPGRPPTVSRLSVLTGINRKEIRRLLETRGKPRTVRAFQRNLAADLFGRWSSDRRYRDKNGRPRPLPFRAKRGASFVQLVRDTTSDLRPTAILEECVRSGLVDVRGKQIVPLADAYVPRAGDADPAKMRMLAEDPHELVSTMLRNVFARGRELWLQQKVAYDHLGSEGTARLRAQLRKRSERFLHAIDRLLASYDRDRNPAAPGGDRRYAALGVYYFEAPED